MQDPNEKHWADLVVKIKYEIVDLLPNPLSDAEIKSIHNFIWASISEAFRRGQKQANGFGMK